MQTGLCSITFRKLSPKELAALAKKAELDVIEWGSDVHCPAGNLDVAKEVAAITAEAGLATSSYGSYYWIGTFENFEDYAKSAEVLGAKTIRVWAYEQLSSMATAEDWQKAIEDSRRIADIAAAKGLSISYEYHGGTLTDTIDATVRLLTETDRDNIFTYWQPPVGSCPDQNLCDIDVLLKMKKLSNLHLFSWIPAEGGGIEKLPLEGLGEDWKRYIKAAVPADPTLLLEHTTEPPSLLLEFTKGDCTQQFLEDAKFLKNLL